MTESADRDPGFWANYREPATPLARAIQYPLGDPNWQDRVIAGYVSTYLRQKPPRADRRNPTGKIEGHGND